MRVDVLLFAALNPVCRRSILAKADWSVVGLVAEEILSCFVIRVLGFLGEILLLSPPVGLLPFFFFLRDVMILQLLLSTNIKQLFLVLAPVVEHVVVQALELVVDLRFEVVHSPVALCLISEAQEFLLLLKQELVWIIDVV